MKKKMTHAIFENIILSYGAKSSHWPAELREDIQAWIQENPTAASIVSRERSFESMLDNYGKLVPDKNYDTSIQAVLNKITNETTFQLQETFFPLIPKISTLVLTLFLGISIGIYFQTEDMDIIDSSELLNTAFSYTLSDSEISL